MNSTKVKSAILKKPINNSNPKKLTINANKKGQGQGQAHAITTKKVQGQAPATATKNSQGQAPATSTKEGQGPEAPAPTIISRHVTAPKIHEEAESPLMMLPVEMREKIYSFLNGPDFVTLRLVCDRLRYEAEVFGAFTVSLPQRPCCLDAAIPFARIRTLTINNDCDELPWGDCESDFVQNVILTKVRFKTLQRLGELKSPLHATLRSSLFQRPIPVLAWANLRSLRVKFYVPPERAEEFMLDNLDTLLEQKFEHLSDLSISLVNAVTPNLQSQYAVRVARFVSQHWLTLKDLHVTMEARRCVRRNYVLPNGGLKSGLREEELKNFKKVQLSKLEMNVSEISCPRCSIWKGFVQQQNQLQTLQVNVSGAEKLPSDFFCNPSKLDQFRSLEVLSIRLWGLAAYYPFDFRYLECAEKLAYLELGRYPEARSQLTRPELLRVECIPEGIHSLNISGFLILSEDVSTLLSRMTSVTSITLLDCGSGLDIGATVEQIPLLSAHPSLTSGLMDLNTAHPNPQVSISIVKSHMEQLKEAKINWRYLYDIGFNQCHRFEFSRVYWDQYTSPLALRLGKYGFGDYNR